MIIGSNQVTIDSLKETFKHFYVRVSFSSHIAASEYSIDTIRQLPEFIRKTFAV